MNIDNRSEKNLNNLLKTDVKKTNKVFMTLFIVICIVIILLVSFTLSNSKGNLDQSGANKPVMSKGMIPVYYDETAAVWKKADSKNKDPDYKWYDYDNKMWANSVTVSEVNRKTYQEAKPGTEISMNDILTMQVWIPRYKYKVWNYNSDGTKTSNPQEIEITFENKTKKTGEITCTDSISGIDGAISETCKLNSGNMACTDATCNGKTYTHPAFTFGDKELKGIWVGKFELTGSINDITTKPDLASLKEKIVSTFETNIMAMNDENNKYGFTKSDDTHMIKNMEWGAVAYLSHSKYGTCTNGTCQEINMNNKEFYKDKSITKDINQISSTTENVYGIYDMSGGTLEYVMGNVVSPNGTTMMSGKDATSNSKYTGTVYDDSKYTSYSGISYPSDKYYDKYSYGTSVNQIKRSKLGDGIKEVYTGETGWYNDANFVAFEEFPWFSRGGPYADSSSYTGIFSSAFSNGNDFSGISSRLVIAS